MFINTTCDKNKYRSFNLSELLGVDNDGHMTILEFLQSCLECGLEEYPFNYYCNCLDQYGNMKRSKINLDNKVRNKNGRLEYFFKGFQHSCYNVSLRKVILSSERIVRVPMVQVMIQPIGQNYICQMENGQI